MSKKLQIGNVQLNNRIVVGPMAGVSNKGFRQIMKEFDAGLIYSEMISDKAICFNNKKTLMMCEVEQEERPLSLQLFGYDIDTMVKAAIYMDENTNCDIIDINMGCPVPKVCKNNGGSAMMNHPEHTFEMIEEIVKNVKKPVTAKIRAGWDHQHINAVEMAIGLEKAGISAIAVHPRTRSDYYSGHSDWSIIKDVKQAVSVPVIGNGDIRKLNDMIEMEKQTGCDGFMVARGCLGNPWLIKQMVEYDTKGIIIDDANYLERINQCLYHARKLIELKGEKNAIKEMRGHACWYINGCPKANKAKAKINLMDTYEELVVIMNEYQKAIETEDFSYFEDEQ